MEKDVSRERVSERKREHMDMDMAHGDTWKATCGSVHVAAMCDVITVTGRARKSLFATVCDDTCTRQVEE